jgi:hypothetical protein
MAGLYQQTVCEGGCITGEAGDDAIYFQNPGPIDSSPVFKSGQ